MAVSELTAHWMNSSSPLTFEYSEENETVRELLRRGKGEVIEEGEKKEVSSALSRSVSD